MKLLMIFSALLALASCASADECKDGKCAKPATVVIRGGLTVYPATSQPVIVCNGGTCYQAGTIIYYTYPVQERPARRSRCCWFGCR